jgi:anti-sigma regulatory factor (Ser/Thr protein kinase)
MTTESQLTVSAQLKNLAKIAEFIGNAAVQAGLDDKATYAVQMATDEACTNIIEHAYGGEGQGSIQLTCHVQEDGLQVVIIDQGANSFDPAQVPPLDVRAPISERKRRGMGLFFIHNLVDNVEFKLNTPQGNQLILFKRKA